MVEMALVDKINELIEIENPVQWILEALHHYTFTGCGEEQWLSKILPLRWKR